MKTLKNTLVLIVLLFLLGGCIGSGEPDLPGEEQPAPVDPLHLQATLPSLESARVILEYVDAVNNKDYVAAEERWIRFLHVGTDLSIIKHFEILSLKEKTGLSGRWVPGRYAEENYQQQRVFYAEVKYEFEREGGENNLTNGIMYHKIVMVLDPEDSSWKFAEMSGGYNKME